MEGNDQKAKFQKWADVVCVIHGGPSHSINARWNWQTIKTTEKLLKSIIDLSKYAMRENPVCHGRENRHDNAHTSSTSIGVLEETHGLRLQPSL